MRNLLTFWMYFVKGPLISDLWENVKSLLFASKCHSPLALIHTPLLQNIV